MSLHIQLDQKRVAEFCRKWKVKELAVFGSVLREDFGPDSDVDVVVTFEPDAPWSLLEWGDMMEQLKAIFRREIHLIEEAGLRNPFRRHAILSSKEVIYAARGT